MAYRQHNQQGEIGESCQIPRTLSRIPMVGMQIIVVSDRFGYGYVGP